MDESIMLWVNGFVAQWETFDNLVHFISRNHLVKGAPIAMLFLFLWFLPRACQARVRLQLLALLVISCISMLAGRMAAVLLPYRARPLHTEALDLQLPLAISPGRLDGWSSFPSDHAVLYASLAASFWMVKRWAGLVAALHALLIVAFARIYLTLHFPTDIIGGAAIGLVVAFLLMKPVTAVMGRTRILEFADRRPQYFHPLLFIILLQMATLFRSAHELARAIVGLFT